MSIKSSVRSRLSAPAFFFGAAFFLAGAAFLAFGAAFLAFGAGDICACERCRSATAVPQQCSSDARARLWFLWARKHRHYARIKVQGSAAVAVGHSDAAQQRTSPL